MRNLRTSLWTRKIRLGMAAAMVGVFGLAMVPLANATPITFYNDAGTHDTLRFTLGCGSANGDCVDLLEALVSEPGDYDSTNPLLGDLFDLSKSGDATELAFVNANTVGGDSYSDGTKHDMGGVGSGSFTTSADYFLIKIGVGPNYGLVHNLSGGSLDLYFTQVDGTGSGFSHWTAFGGTTVVVPEPAALGMFGTGVLLIGLFLGLRRRDC